jgi:uncharacterized protein (DUF433 family)
VKLCRREVGTTDLAHLARSDEFAQRAQCVGDRSLLIGVVHLIEVDVVSVEAPQRLLTGEAHIVGTRAKVSVVDGHAELGGNDDRVAATLECLAEKDLRLGRAIDVGGIEEVDPRLDRGVDDVGRSSLVETGPEVVATDADFRHLQ